MEIGRNNDITAKSEDPGSPDALGLMKELDEELLSRYPAQSVHGMKPSEAAVFIIARIDGHAVGCGALREVSKETVEIKRMFVRNLHRRKGISKKILKALESTAGEFGYKNIWLETGEAQPEAIRLYESSGYHRIPRYGEYTHDPLSVCFGKQLR